MVTAYVTAPTDVAAELAQDLVERQLAACVNRIPCDSTYWWDDEVVCEEEALLFVKTTADRYPALVDHLVKVHPYDVPCIERFDEDEVFDAFQTWRDARVDSE